MGVQISHFVREGQKVWGSCKLQRRKIKEETGSREGLSEPHTFSLFLGRSRERGRDPKK
jgi:hypothetical protein